MNISERIRFLRKEQLHLTQEALGEPLGLTRANIANIEAGRIAVTDRVIISICKEFNVNEEWLRNEEGDLFKKPSDEVGYYVADLLDYEGEGNPFYDIIIEMMKNYQELDEKSKVIIKEYIGKVMDSVKNKKKED